MTRRATGVGGLVALLLCGCWVADVPEGDRLAVLTVHDLAAYGVRGPDSSARESFKRINNFDRSYSIEYEFQREQPDPLYLAVTIDVERNPQSAATTMSTKRKALILTLRAGGLHARKDEAPAYGDEAYFGTLLRNSQQIGHLVMVRRGAAVYTVALVGLVFASADDWPPLLDPKLAVVDSLTATRSRR
ncbi:MAG TPA: hypothetical protein VGQ06_05575 [Gemmatimonadales bacterium]|jgi:hypothetical protein|nr:hypothetical protein [Gemmatimonadales bacterium]